MWSRGESPEGTFSNSVVEGKLNQVDKRNYGRVDEDKRYVQIHEYLTLGVESTSKTEKMERGLSGQPKSEAAFLLTVWEHTTNMGGDCC